MSETKKFVVTGDTEAMMHEFDVGTIVVMVEDDDTTEKLYQDVDGNDYWVHDNDVKLLEEV